jgi:hypothetical protein
VNFPENPAATPESPERKAIIELRKAHASMLTLFQLLALCCLLLTGSIFVVIFKQVSVARKQVDEAVAYVQDYNKTFAPQIELVRAELEAIAKTNQGLVPLMRRYFSTNMPKNAPTAAKTSAR